MRQHLYIKQSLLFLVICSCFLLKPDSSTAQQDPIGFFTNGSFEGLGAGLSGAIPTGWANCSSRPDGTPDMPPGPFGISQSASNGQSFVGFVTTSGGYYEGIGQPFTFIAGVEYIFNIDAMNGSWPNGGGGGYGNPTTLQIYAGDAPCELTSLIFEALIDNASWETFTFTFTPDRDYSYIKLRGAPGVDSGVFIDNIRLDGSKCIPIVDGGEVCGTGGCVEEVDLSYERNGSEIWNSKDKLNFAEKYALKVPFEKVEWYVKDNIKQEYRKIEDPTNFYFCAMGPDRDEWGVVTIQPFYQNSEGSLCALDSTTLEVIDQGLYFRSADKKIQRWKEELYEENPTLYNGFFDPSKPTIILAHGWQPGANKRHLETGSDERGRLIEGASNPEDVAKHWLDRGWNVAIYYWTQFSEFADEGSTINLFPENTSINTYTANPQWYREDGTMSTEGSAPLPIGEMFASAVINLRTVTGSTTEMRWTGHSVGAILITWASLHMDKTGNQAHLPSRLAYLDPCWEPGLFEMWEKDFLPRIDDFPVVEWYQSSPYNIFFGEGDGAIIKDLLQTPNYPNGNAIYNDAIQNSAYVRLHPLWQEGYPVGGQFLHASARRHYYSSFKDNRKPTLLERGPVSRTPVVPTPGGFVGGVPFCEDDAVQADAAYFDLFTLIDLFDSFELEISEDGSFQTACFYPQGTVGPSAKATLEELKRLRGYPLSQLRGMATINTNDDGYGIQRKDKDVEFHSPASCNTGSATEYSCQEAVCTANCEDPVFNDGLELRKIEVVENSVYAGSAVPVLEEVLETRSGTFKAYPNPTNDALTVEIPKGYQEVRVELYTIQGVKQLEQLTSANEGDTSVMLKLDNLPAGLYILTVHDAQGQHLYATR
ncbi:MAG: T9SS type A sorting domain-containing protein, partial [Bacteroidota bacterium]